jgi:hypothetical protein
MPGFSPFHYCFNNPIMMRDPFGLEPDGQSTKRGSVFSKRNPDDNPDAGITDEVVCEAEGPWSHWWSAIDGSRRGNEWTAYTGAARKGEPTAADKVERANQKKEVNDKLNKIIGAFGIGWSTKEIIIQGAVAEARGISTAKVNNISYIRSLGATGAGYMNVVKQVSRVANVLGAGLTIADGAVNGFQAHHAADLGIQAAIYGIGASIPVAGWILGGGYFLGDMYFQSTHNGKSITQYYLDRK